MSSLTEEQAALRLAVATDMKYGCLYNVSNRLLLISDALNLNLCMTFVLQDFKPKYWYFFAAVLLRKFIAAIVVNTAVGTPAAQVWVMIFLA